MRMKIPNLNSQVRIMINKLNSYIRIVIHKLVCATVSWIMMWHHKYIGVVVNDFNPQIGVVVNNLHLTVQWQGLAVRLACYRTGVFVYGKLAKVYGLSVGGIANQCKSKS